MAFLSSYESPRTRRLKADLAALEKLRAESSVFQFEATGSPPQRYLLIFNGRGLCRGTGGKVVSRDEHQVEIKLGTTYPRTMPELRWITPIYHPNISEIGMVCLGGYGTHWVPSLTLDELCVMLWDMIRYHNYDVKSPYNREAALWAVNQAAYQFPVDIRPLRDVRLAQGRIESPSSSPREQREGPPVLLDLGEPVAVPAAPAPEPAVAGPPPEITFLD